MKKIIVVLVKIFTVVRQYDDKGFVPEAMAFQIIKYAFQFEVKVVELPSLRRFDVLEKLIIKFFFPLHDLEQIVSFCQFFICHVFLLAQDVVHP